MREIILAGRPNSGKSTLFNRLATSQQKVANYAGCTVEKKTAFMANSELSIAITDLPGVYSLQPNTKDEEVALAHLRETKDSSQVVIVADGNNLEQELALPLLLKKAGHDIVIAVNMMDEVAANQRILNLNGMTDLAGIPFFPVSAKTGDGVESLKKYLCKSVQEPKAQEQSQNLPELKVAFRQAREEAKQIYSKNAKDPKQDLIQKRTEAIDRFLVHPFFGPVVFFVTMFLLFQSIFVWTVPLSDGVQAGANLLQDFVKSHLPEGFLTSLLADGVIAGVGAVLVFVPQISILFFLIGILELSGYLPRAAYMVDRLLRPYGLEGKVFIPLLSSVACAVPGIMSTRTIENERTRILTIMISPLMTCSARLPVYTLLIGTFIPATRVYGLSLRGLAMFVMYLLGVVMALLVAFLLHKFKFGKTKTNLDFLHLPQYRAPDWKTLWRFVWLRTFAFLKKAGRIIFAMAVLLWLLLSYPQDRSFMETKGQELAALTGDGKAEKTAQIQNQISSHNLAYSVGGRVGRLVSPLFRPLGYDWKLTIGVLGSLAAREVFVSTVGTVFALGETKENTAPLTEALLAEKREDGKPAYTLATCFSLLAFFAFSLQCISTIGVARRETNSWRIPAFMFVYMFMLAYGAAFTVYQVTNLFL